MNRVDTVALVACTAKKLPHAARAGDMYMPSEWFKGAFPIADRISEQVWILSAKHHLLDTDEVIEPYQKTLNTMSLKKRTEWGNFTWENLCSRDEFKNATHIVWFAGLRYREQLIHRCQSAGKINLIPMAGLRLGDQLSWLRSNRGISEEELLDWCSCSPDRIAR